ncbi:MAG TPA: signal peptidase I [Acidimicrobiales bacterium]
MRDVSSPSGLSGDDRGDAPGTAAGRPTDRRGPGPRHLAADGDARPSIPLPRTGGVAAARARARTPVDGNGRDGEPKDDEWSDDAGKALEIKPQRSLRRTVFEWAAVILGGIVIALVVEAFLVQAFWIPSPSMVPTLEVGDRVLVNKLAYKLHDVHRGDVIVFTRPPAARNGSDTEIKDLIKRVVAVGGDTIEARDGRVYVNGELIDEPYLEPGTVTDRLPSTTIPEGQVFVMGDNRENSEDSRFFGAIDEDTIVGRAFVKVLPLTDLGWL